MLFRSYYKWLLENQERIEKREYEALLPMIAESCKIKRAVVEADPTEQGERALLNFGHTVGHAVEKLKDFKLSHGECVAIGIVAAGWISLKSGFLSKEYLDEILRGLEAFSLPTYTDGLESKSVVEVTRSDKKMEAGSIKFVMLRRIGEAFVDRTVTEEELLFAVSRILGGSNEKTHEI